MTIKSDLLDVTWSTNDTLPSAAMQAITDALQPLNRTAAEISAGVTPSDYAYPFGHVHRYGAVGDGSTDDAAAITAAYTAVGTGGGGEIQFEALTYKVSALTFDGALNVKFRGRNHPNIGNISSGSFANATVLQSTVTSGNAITFTGTGYAAKGISFQDLLIYAATTGYVVSFTNCSDISWVRAKVINDGSGDAHGINYSRCYYVTHGQGMMVAKGQNQRSGTSKGVNIDKTGASSWFAGLYVFEGGSSIQSFQTGLSIGDGSPSTASETYAAIQYRGELLACENGAALQYGVKSACFHGAYIESNTNIGIWVTLEARGVSIKGCIFLNSTAAIADVLFGLSGAVDSQYKKFYNCAVEECVFHAVNIAGVRVYSTSSDSRVRVINNHFTLGTSGALGVASDTAVCRVGDNIFSGFAAGNDESGLFLPPPVEKVKAFAASDATPSVSNGSVFITDTGTYTITSFDDGIAGQEITVISGGATTFDTTSTTLYGSSVDIVTASGDITTWVCQNATTWWLKGYVDVSVDNSGGA